MFSCWVGDLVFARVIEDLVSLSYCIWWGSFFFGFFDIGIVLNYNMVDFFRPPLSKKGCGSIISVYMCSNCTHAKSIRQVPENMSMPIGIRWIALTSRGS